MKQRNGIVNGKNCNFREKETMFSSSEQERYTKEEKLLNIDKQEGLQKRFFHIASYELA